MSQVVVHQDEQGQLALINSQLTEWKNKGCHLLSPMTIQSIPALHRPIMNVVYIDPDPKNKEVYIQRGGGFSLSAIAFKKLLDAMVVRWDHRLCGRMDDGTDPNRVHYRMVGQVKGLDGLWHDIMGDKEIRMETVIEELTDNYREKAQDYYDKTDEKSMQFKREFANPEAVSGWVREKVRQDALQMKKHMLARAQTGAMARACKSRGIRETYDANELKRPFVFPALVPNLDPNRPDDRAVLRDQALGVTHQLYPTGGMVPAAEKAIEFYDIPAPSPTIHTVVSSVTSVPTMNPAESLRADFMALEIPEQVRCLQDLVKKKAYAGKLTGDLAKWTAHDRTSFFDRLTSMADAPVAGSNPLPFD